MSRPDAQATQLIDDERTRVTRFNFAPGAQTGWHEHGMDYVIVALVDCQMLLEDPDGTSREVLVPAGSSYARQKGIKHNVINAGTQEMSFVEVELK